MDDSAKRKILHAALDKARSDGLILDIWGHEMDRTPPLREIGHALEVLPYDLPARFLCGCTEAALMRTEELPAWATSRRSPIDLAHGRWADGRGRRFDAWIGQCPECRTIYWRIQQA